MPEKIDYDSDSSDDSFADSIFTTYDDTSDDEVDDGDISFDDDDSESETEDDLIGVNISHSLILWALNFGISHTALTALLGILRHFGDKELPKHAKTLLRTPRIPITPRPCPPGEAFYYGIQNSYLKMADSAFENMDSISTDMFIDGLSVSDSSVWDIWPIIGTFVGRMDLNPYLVHAYAGPGKPHDVDNYLEEFCEEITELEANGVLCGESRVIKPFTIRAFICDAPAAAFTSGRIGHSSYHGCPKCDQICTRDETNSRLIYQTTAGNLRTDESFLFREDPSHHRPEFLDRHSSLECAGIRHVSQFVIDPMHLIDIGISKKIALVITKSLTSSQFVEMVGLFLSFRPYVPSEFERKPRTLKQLKKFKANEMKQMMNYTLPVLIRDFVDTQIYDEVLLLHVGIRLLQDSQSYRQNLDGAREILNLFVQEYPEVFGVENFTFNTHCLIHIPDVVEEYGPLYSFSAYRYENHQRILNRLLRKKSLHLQQLFNRFGEISNANDIERNRVDKSFQYGSFILRANHLRDGCVMVKPGIPLEITELKESNGSKFIRGRRYLRCENFFDYPVKSMENLGIILASTPSSVEEDFPADDVLSEMDRFITKKWIVPTHTQTTSSSIAFKPTTSYAAISPDSPATPVGSTCAQASTSNAPRTFILQAPPTPRLGGSQSLSRTVRWSGEIHSSLSCARNATTGFNANALTVNGLRTYSKCTNKTESRNVDITGTSKLNSSQPTNGVQLSDGLNPSKSNPFSSVTRTIRSLTAAENSSKTGSDFNSANKAEYRDVNINGKIVPLKLVKINRPTKIGYNVAEQQRYQSKSNHAEVVRNASGLCSLTSKCDEFRVQPKPGHIEKGNTGDDKLASVTTHSPDFKSPQVELNNHSMGGSLEIISIETPGTEPNGNRIESKDVEVVRDVPTLKLTSFTSKRAEFRVLPQPGGIKQATVTCHSPDFELPRVERLDDDPMGGTLGNLSIEMPETEPDVNRKGGEFNLQEELREIRKSQQETLAFVKRMTEKEEAHRNALSFPLETNEEVEKMETLLRSKAFRKKLVDLLQRKIRRTKKDDVVAELISFIFTPDTLDRFNVTGVQRKNPKTKRKAFKNLRINQVIKDIANIDYELYTVHLTRVIHKMQMRHTRKMNKQLNDLHDEGLREFDDDTFDLFN